MVKQYDRLLNPLLRATKQDFTAFDDHLWRLKVALDRVRCIGPYTRAWRKRPIDKVLEERAQLASYVEEWRGSNLNDGENTVQLGPLREAVYQLEDMADDIEYRRWKLRHGNFSMKPNLASYLIRRVRLVFKLRKTEELLKDLHVVIEDLKDNFAEMGKAMSTESNIGSTEKHTHADGKVHEPNVSREEEYISKGKGSCGISEVQYTNYTPYHISEGNGSGEISEEKDSDNKYSQQSGGAHLDARFDIRHDIKEQLVDILLQQGGDLVIPFGVSPETEKGTIPVYDIFHDKRVTRKFGLLLRVRASDGPVSTVSHQGTLTESILKLMNSDLVNGALHIEKCCKCRSCWNTDVIGVTLSGKEGSSNRSHVEEVEELQEKLSQFFGQETKFLLILEDVLEDQLPQLDHLLSALFCGNSESRIVISSQSLEVLQSVRGVKISNDGNIQHHIFWKFFRNFAFRDAKEGEDEKMKHTGKMMIAHLKSFPLAAKMVAKMLNARRDYQFWTAILEKLSRAVKTDCQHRQLLSLLKICYDQLPAPLRLCFQYCSLFPHNWTFTSEDLVQLWMSQDFLVEDLVSNSDSNKVQTVEDVGKRYFGDLCSRSFFEALIDDGHTSLYRVHTSVHCFAQVAAGEEFMRIESDIRPEESLRARHLSVKSANLSALWNVDALFRLRTLIILGPVHSDARVILQHILSRLKKIRTLDLAGCDVEEFPELANDLRKHLRYLSIYDTGIDKLPDDICEFFHLQVLNVQGSRIKKLPQKITRLCNLRRIIGPTFLTSAVKHIGKLKGLQELENFEVSKKQKIQELGGIKDLGGSISITNLEQVKFPDAAKAKLHDKSSLKSLKLEWSDMVLRRSSICGFNTLPVKNLMSANVLEHLKPNSDILILEINRYIGNKSPSWLTAGVLPNIETITLRNCTNLVEPPPLGQLPCLKKLKLVNWKELRSFPQKQGLRHPCFLKLIELSMEDMPELKVWSDCDESFPRLELLTIRHCVNLKKIPLLKSSRLAEIHLEEVGLEDLPLTNKSLKRLTMEGCKALSTVGGNHVDGRYLPSTLLQLRITACECIKQLDFKAPISLQDLHIEECRQLIELTINSAKVDLKSLRTVHLDKISLLRRYYKLLVCLEELVIEGGIHDALDELPKSRLRKLCLIKCQDESFFTEGEDKARPKDMEEFTSLKYLSLEQCNKMMSLPYLPYNLDELRIHECQLLENLCREDDPGWFNISHVPYKYI